MGEVELGAAIFSSVARRYARLLAGRGAEIGERPLVLPNGDFFPDAFERDQASAEALVRRMQEHGGIDDIPVGVHVVQTGPGKSSSCSSGACTAPIVTDGGIPRIVDSGERWILQVPDAELGHPVHLTTMLARTLAHVFLIETAEEGADGPIAEGTADLAAVALGFGPLLLEGAYMYSKSCGGPQVAQATHLGLPELAAAVALFCALGNHSPKRALKELDTTQRALLTEAVSWTESNPELVKALGSDPDRVAREEPSVREPQPWLLRVLGTKSRATRRTDSLPEDFDVEDLDALARTLPERPRSQPERKERDPKQDELRALVDQAFGTPADAE